MKIRKRLTAALTAVCLIFTSVAAFAFSDVAENEWYADNIAAMTQMGLITGYEDGSFRPNDTITYAEFISIVARCTGNNSSPTGAHWASGTMNFAYNQGWYDYDEIYETDYDLPITRQMAVKIIDLAFKIPENEHENNAYYKYMTSIADFNEISGRYGYLVVRAYNNGILTGDENNRFNPTAFLTRAEACAIIMRAKGSSVAAPPTSAPVQNYISGGVSQNGRLSVAGTQLVNQKGEPIVLRGMSSHGIQWFPQFTSYEAIKTVADSGANLFRIAMYTEEGGYITQRETVKQAVFNAVDNAVKNDMYVIIDWHILSDGDPMKHLNEAIEFFAQISDKYRDTPNVIYEICNEPNGNISWGSNVKPYAEAVISVIRQNTDGIILVGSPTWSQDVDIAADDPLSFNNIMYTCHFYAGTHGSDLRNKIDYALSKGAPIFVSEWGTSAADGNGGIFTDSAAEWLNFLAIRGISWANWSWCDKNESSAALVPGTDPNNITYDSLTQSGKFVFSQF